MVGVFVHVEPHPRNNWGGSARTASVVVEHEFLASALLLHHDLISLDGVCWLRFFSPPVLLVLVPFHSLLSSFLCLDSTWSLLWLWSGVVRGGLRRLRSRRVLASSALVSRCDFPSLVSRGARRAGGAWDWFLYLVPIEPWLCFSTTISGPGVAVVQYGRARVWA